MTPGRLLDGKYELLSELGDGGMGSVWRARDVRLDSPVAVKLMHPQLAGSADARARFEREAKAAARVRSPHVVQILDIGVDEITRTPFIVMELLSGQNLRERLARSRRLDPRERRGGAPRMSTTALQSTPRPRPPIASTPAIAFTGLHRTGNARALTSSVTTNTGSAATLRNAALRASGPRGTAERRSLRRSGSVRPPSACI